jgi:hypothetical protein
MLCWALATRVLVHHSSVKAWRRVLFQGTSGNGENIAIEELGCLDLVGTIERLGHIFAWDQPIFVVQLPGPLLWSAMVVYRTIASITFNFTPTM